MRTILVSIALLLLTQVSGASEIQNILGVVPGEISTIKGKSTGGPIEILRMPTPDKDLSNIYPDLEIMISRENRKVIGVGSKRAYSVLRECEDVQEEVRGILKAIFPGIYKGNDPRWQYESEEKGITAGVTCESSSPYPVLRLDVTHTATNEEILKLFR